MQHESGVLNYGCLAGCPPRPGPQSQQAARHQHRILYEGATNETGEA
jgi:hypothetical protein